MKRVLPWVGLGLLAAAIGGTTFGCSNSSSGGGGNGGSAGGIVGGSGGGGTGGTAGTSTGGTAGTATGGGGGVGPTSSLGATCTTDADCGSGMKCYTPQSTDFSSSGGPARGYCTKSCSSDADCTSLDSSSHCLNTDPTHTFCLQGCDPAGTSNCNGRYDSLCLPYGPGGDAAPTANACTPYCATDNDCNGLKCDLKTGLCTSTPSTGLPVGSPCNPQAAHADGGTDPCAGFCIGFQGQPPTVGTCSAFCGSGSLGHAGACGSNPAQGSPQNAACLFQATFNSGGTIGICGQLCNCDSDCMGSGMVCQSWAAAGVSQPSQFTSAFHKAGLCVSATGAEGGVVTGIPTCPGGTGGSGGTSGTAGAGGTSAGGSSAGGSSAGGSAGATDAGAG